jgi:spore coat-associated protein N
MSTTTNSNSRKVLVPLATLLVAGAVAVGSGATWTAESGSAVSAKAGNLVHVNSQDKMTLAVTNLKPGAVETGSLTIKNTGTLDSTLALKPSGNVDGFADGAVTLTIKAIHGSATTTVYSGDFADLNAEKAVGALDADVTSDQITVDFTVAMASTATKINQGAAAKVNLEFVTTQTNGDESGASWIPFV